MLSERLSEIVNFKLERGVVNGPKIFYSRDMMAGKTPYFLKLDSRILRDLLINECNMHPSSAKNCEIFIDSKFKAEDKRLGQLDTKEAFDPIKIRLSGPRFWEFYQERVKEVTPLQAIIDTKQEVVKTIVHETYHFVCRFCNNSYVMFSFFTNPGLNQFAEGLSALNKDFDDEEILCEYKAQQIVADDKYLRAVYFTPKF